MSRLRAATVLSALLFVSTAVAQPENDSWTSAQPVTIRLSSFKYDPAIITLQHGVAYAIRLENLASGGHDFAAPDFFSKADIAASDRAKLSKGKVGLGGGENVTIHLIAPAPGSYKIRCTHFMHSMFGMTGRIVVQ